MKNSIKFPLISIGLCLCSDVFAQNSPAISKQQVIDDVTFLASDELKGRANFSPEITKAAAYIAERFKQAGLVPFNGAKQFQQPFSLFNVTSELKRLDLNQTPVDKQKVAIATSYRQLNWSNTDDLVITHIAKQDDFRQVLSQINAKGGDHLVLVDPAHDKIFSGYKGYFDKGINKFSLNQGGSLVIVLTDLKQVDSVAFDSASVIKEQKLANVVGVLPGNTSQNVLFSAHYDHLGVGGDNPADNIYNGADDDASGTSAIMNIADYYASMPKQQRGVIFAAFTAEEIGGYGSKFFSNQIDPEKISAMINIEMIGKVSKFGSGNFWMTGFERSNLAVLLNQELKPMKQQVYADPYPKQKLFYRSDNATLARLGVPAHSFSSTQIDKDKHYHNVSDDIASLDLDSMTQVIRGIARATQGVVSGKVTPTRVDTSSIKPSGKIY